MHPRVLAALCPLAASVSAFAPPLPPGAASVAVLAIDGRGFGHGVGMPQDGAFWMAKGGATATAVLGHFYPGTSLGRATGSVRVEVLTSPTQDAILAFPEGGQVRDGQSGATSAGFPISVPPGGQVRVWFDGARYFASQPLVAPPRPSSGGAGGGYAVASTARTPAQGPIPTTPTTAPPPPRSTTTLLPRRPSVVPTTTTAPPPASTAPKPSAPKPATATPPASSGRPLWAVPATGASVAVPARQRQYRGSLEAVAAPGTLRLIDQLDVEQYLLGLGEVRDGSWPPAALQAQAIVARTYALRAMAASGELCDTDRCQVYLGQQAEYGAMTKAVTDTRGRVVVYGLGLASTVYSSNGGGVSATPEEGFGTSAKSYPYLRSVHYTTNDPGPWSVRVALGDIASRFSYKGEVTGARVTKAGPSGRAIEITLDGSSGTQVLEGTRFATGLGLRSTLFSFRVEQAATAPPPPAPADFLQAPPEQLPTEASTETSPDAPATAVRSRTRTLHSHRASDRRALIVVTALALAALLSGTAAFRRPRTAS